MISTAPILACAGVSKRYRRFEALADFELEVKAGEVFGLLGPNGAGKTTFIRLLMGLAAPTTGEIRLFGEDLFRDRQKIARRMGAVVEAPIFHEYLTGWENLYHLSQLSGGAPRKEIERALDIVGLMHARDQRVKAYSYGMKQRLGIAQALLPASEFMILDEPTNGLDPHGIAGVRDLIRVLAREFGMTVFLSSHLLVEVEQVCDRVAIIDHGRKVLEGTVGELKAAVPRLVVRVRQGEQVEAVLKELGGTAVEVGEETVSADFALREEEVPELVRALVARELEVLEVRRHVRTLEDVFIEHTSMEGGDGRADTIRAEKAGGGEA